MAKGSARQDSAHRWLLKKKQQTLKCVSPSPVKQEKKILTLSKKKQPTCKSHAGGTYWLSFRPAAICLWERVYQRGIGFRRSDKRSGGEGGSGGREHLFGQAVTSLRHDATASVHQRRQLADCSILRLVCGLVWMMWAAGSGSDKGSKGACHKFYTWDSVLLLWAVNSYLPSDVIICLNGNFEKKYFA